MRRASMWSKSFKIWCLRLAKTLPSCARVSSVATNITKAAKSKEWSRTSWCKEARLPSQMAPVIRAFTGQSSQTKECGSSTLTKDYCLWPTQVPTPMAPNSSCAMCLVLTWTESTLCSAAWSVATTSAFTSRKSPKPSSVTHPTSQCSFRMRAWSHKIKNWRPRRPKCYPTTSNDSCFTLID